MTLTKDKRGRLIITKDKPTKHSVRLTWAEIVKLINYINQN